MGREADAGRILSGVAIDFRQIESAGDHTIGTEVASARIAALSGDAAGAKDRLRDALQRGWKGQSADFGVDLTTDPAFASLQDDVEFATLVAGLHRAQKAEAERLARVDFKGI
jgi:hypothetical protein